MLVCQFLFTLSNGLSNPWSSKFRVARDYFKKKKRPLKSKCSDQGAWPNAFTQSLVTFALVTMIVSLCNLVLHWEADEKLHTERRKGFCWKLLITRRELGCQPYREGGEQLIKVTQKADILVQKAENIWGHLVQGQPCLSICTSPQCHFVILHFHKA